MVKHVRGVRLLIDTGSDIGARFAQGLRGFGADVITYPTKRLGARLRAGVESSLSCDAIIHHDPQAYVASIEKSNEGARYLRTEQREVDAARDIATLPAFIAMRDGRRWSAVPQFALRPDTDQLYHQGFIGVGEPTSVGPVSFLVADLPADSYHVIVSRVYTYRQQILRQFDSCGFMVRFIGGRFVVGPALTPRSAMSTDLYFGAADQRDDDVFWTLDRDLLSIEAELAEFEWLINEPRVTERELQRFLETHPHFLAPFALGRYPLCQPRLRTHDGADLVPDFILQPSAIVERDDAWTILELKRATHSLVVGDRFDKLFSRTVVKGIRQLQRYRAALLDQRNERDVIRMLGRNVRHPHLALLIGRTPHSHEQMAAFNELQGAIGVRIVAYDELLSAQRDLYEIEKSIDKFS